MGAYAVDAFVIDSQLTSASVLYIHGGGATLTPIGEGTLMLASIPLSIRDLEFDTTNHGSALSFGNGGTWLLERVVIHSNAYGILMGDGTLTLRDVAVIGGGPGNTGINLVSGSAVTADRLVVRGYSTCIRVEATGAPKFSMTNGLIHDCVGRALDMEFAQGIIEASTIANSGTDTGSGPRAVACGSNMTVRSTIVWAPGGTPRVSIAGCNLAASIAGPTPVPGAMSSDPLFVDPANGDFHLRQGSPARDAAMTGPAVDLDHFSRPRGARFDIGAYEAEP
jgi:hypothetical protein